MPPSQSRTLGPLDRGHDAKSLVAGVAREEIPKGWRCLDVWRLKNDRIRFMLMRPDTLVYQFDITYDAINAGHTRDAVRRAVAQLSEEE